MPHESIRPVYSVTSLVMYECCPLQYFYAFVKRIPPPRTPTMTTGVTVHKLLSDHFRQPQLLLPDAPPDVMEMFLAFQASRFNVPPVVSEKSFKVSMDRGDVRGRIDVVLPSGEAGLEIVDFKSGRLRSRQELQGNLQLPLYALAASGLWRTAASELSYTYYFLRPQHEESFRASDLEFELLRERVAGLMDLIEQGDFAPALGCKCYACEHDAMGPSLYSRSRPG